MTLLDIFPPTREDALARIASVRPADYARTRNAIDGAVTRLSPYITHGIVSLPEVLAGVASRHGLGVQHKFIFELGWREYFHHVWRHRGSGILHSLHAGALPDSAYSRDLPSDIREARTGVAVIDQAVRTLYATGYLHNHARMWLASYVVHLRKVHWRAGADWMVAHLLDGDLASNHLSWQWVAGTASRKPYLFNAENVARYAPPEWRSPGSVIDTSYEALEEIARNARPAPTPPRGDGIEEPALVSVPLGVTALESTELAGCDVWLVHPFALGDPPVDLSPDCMRIGWWPSDYHAQWPWSAARWAFVGARMAELAPLVGHGSRLDLSRALAGARSVQTLGNLHVHAMLPREIKQRAPPNLFADVDGPCASFSAWWNIATRGVAHLGDLPGLAQLTYSHSIVAGGLPEMS